MKIVIASAVLTGWATSSPVVATTLDYLSARNSINFRSDVNGIGQTFVALEPLLVDASLLISEAYTGHSWANPAYMEIRGGLPGNFDGTSGNVIFHSQPIDVSTLPSPETYLGTKMYELRASLVGLNSPIGVTPGSTYSLVIVTPSSTDSLNYAEQSPSSYPDGGESGHNRAYANSFWSGPYDNADLAFKVVTAVPEPGCMAIVAAGAVFLIGRRR